MKSDSSPRCTQMIARLRHPLLLLVLAAAACSPGGASPTGDGAGPGPVADGSPVQPGGPDQEPAKEYSDSKMLFETKAIDLGEIAQHEEHPLEFPFRIEGQQPLVLTEAAPSCGCTDIKIEYNGQPYVFGEPMEPGYSGRVFGLFESGTFKELKKTDIKLRGNGLDMPIQLDIQALIQPIFVVTPRQALFGDVPARKGAEREIIVSAIEDFTITQWVNTPPGFLIEEVGEAEPTPDGKRVIKRFRIRLLKDAETRRHYGSFLARTSIDRRLEIVLQANVYGPVKYQPDQRLTFGMLDRGATPVRRVQILSATGEDIPEPQLEVLDSELFQAELTVREAGKAYVAKVSISGDAPLGTHAGRLRIHFPEGSELDPQVLAISAIVRDRRH